MMPTDHRAALRTTARARAFEAGFAHDTDIVAGMLLCVLSPLVQSEQDARCITRDYAREYRRFSDRSLAVDERIQQTLEARYRKDTP